MVAYMTVVTMRPLYPGLTQVAFYALGLLPALAPIIAFFLAFGQAMSLTRKGNAIHKWMLVRYFVGAPIRIFLTLLIIIALLTFTLAPMLTFALAPITFYAGITQGALPLLVGTAIHVFGIVPLYFLDRWLRPPSFPPASTDVC